MRWAVGVGGACAGDDDPRARQSARGRLAGGANIGDGAADRNGSHTQGLDGGRVKHRCSGSGFRDRARAGSARGANGSGGANAAGAGARRSGGSSGRRRCRAR